MLQNRGLVDHIKKQRNEKRSRSLRTTGGEVRPCVDTVLRILSLSAGRKGRQGQACASKTSVKGALQARYLDSKKKRRKKDRRANREKKGGFAEREISKVEYKKKTSCPVQGRTFTQKKTRVDKSVVELKKNMISQNRVRGEV